MADLHLSNKPIKTRPLPPGCEDRTGMKRGALTVVGYYGPAKDAARSSKWVVRCECGCYTVRSGRALRRHNMDDYCFACEGERVEFKRSFLAANGRYPEYFEFPTEASQ